MENNIALNGLLATYVKLAAQEEELKAQKDQLKSQIIDLMGSETKYVNSAFSCSLVESTTYKYPDEVSTMKRLTDLGAEHYIIKTIDTKALNEYLRKNTASELTSALLKENLAQPSTTKRLTVKEV